ncbi:MAG: hypothetical protein J1E77_05810 [Prevotella sp.]|nr:hypothetical protein [Prevotella sp.]
MKNFDTNRFGQVLKLEFAAGLKPLLWSMSSMLLVYLFFFWFVYNVGMGCPINSREELYIKGVCESVSVVGAIAMALAFLASAARAFQHEQKKQRRTVWLMLPATNLERFLSRWVYVLVSSVAAGILMFFAADALHAAWLWLSGRPVMSATPYFLARIIPRVYPDSPSGTWTYVLQLYCLVAAAYALFMLGGVVFRKFQVVSTVLVAFMLLYALTHTESSARESMLTFTTVNLLLSALWLACACLLVWLAYRLYCRWQVVTRRFVNLS